MLIEVSAMMLVLQVGRKTYGKVKRGGYILVGIADDATIIKRE